MTSTTDANGNTIMYTYNSFGQVSEITDQEGKSEYFYYNEEGHQVEHHDRNGNEIHRMYTLDGNLAYERAIDPLSKYAVINQYVHYPDGTIKRAIGGGSTYEYTYTKTGQLKTKSSNGKSLLAYTYDQNGNRKTLIDPSGKQVTYTYDSMDRMTKVEDSGGQALAEYQYTKSGKLQSTVLGNGVKTEFKKNGRFFEKIFLLVRADEIGCCLRRAFESGTIKTEKEFKEVLSRVLFGSKEI